MKYFIFLSFLLFCTYAHAEILPSDTQTELLEDFSGGMNTSVNSKKLAKNFSRYIRNFYVDKIDGKLIEANGFSVIGVTSTLRNINFFFRFKREGVQDEFLISDSSKVLSTIDFNSYTLVRGNLNDSNVINAAQVEDKVWFTNGVDPVWTYNGSTVTILDGKVYSTTPTPNVPIGKFIAYYQGLPFIANSSYSASALHFAADASSDAIAIAPDDYRAWPEVNQLNVNNGDGFPITALWAKNGLYVSKENGIYTVSGKDRDSYFPIKTQSEAGAIFNTSVVFGDNLTYFKGRNGIYEFNGNTSRRITDAIQAEMDLVNNTAKNTSTLLWDLSSDFERGKPSGISTDNGFLTYKSSIAVNSYTSGTGYTTLRLNSVSTATTFMTLQNFDIANHSNFDGYLWQMDLLFRPELALNCQGSYLLDTEIKNLRTNVSTHSQVMISQFGPDIDGTGTEVLRLNFNNTFPIKLSDFSDGNIIYKQSLDNTGSCTMQLSSAAISGSASIFVRPSSASFVSDIATVTSINAWSIMDSVDMKDSGVIQYFFRTATSLGGIDNAAWNSINLGTIINSNASNTFVQWASSFTSNDININPSIDSVSIDYSKSGVTDSRSIVGAFWDNRLWMAVSTITIGNTNLIYVKAKRTHRNPDAAIFLSGFNVKSMLPTENIFYAGSSTAGVVLRLDYGTSLNGLPITPVYEFPDLVLGDYFYKKDIIKYLIDAEANGGTVNVKTSVNGGNYFNNSVSLSGSGDLLKEINSIAINSGKTFRIRIDSNDTDKPLRLGTLGIQYKRSQKF